MSGFEFTPFGIVPLGTPMHAVGDQMMAPVIRSLPESTEAVIAQASPPVTKLTAPVKVTPTKPVTGKDILRMAKARVKDIDKLLSAVPALEMERAAMQRLVDAANAKPGKVVRLRNGTND